MAWHRALQMWNSDTFIIITTSLEHSSLKFLQEEIIGRREHDQRNHIYAFIQYIFTAYLLYLMPCAKC